MSKNKKVKYEFILRGGHSLKNAFYHLFKKVWQTEIIPKGWNKTTLLQLAKSKGDLRDQDNTRFIHLKDQVPKVFSHMIISQVKETIMTNMTPYQIGTKKGHRPQENILVMISMMKLKEKQKTPMLIQLYDISKFFNKEHLPDVMEELYSSGALAGNKFLSSLMEEIKSANIFGNF